MTVDSTNNVSNVGIIAINPIKGIGSYTNSSQSDSNNNQNQSITSFNVIKDTYTPSSSSQNDSPNPYDQIKSKIQSQNQSKTQATNNNSQKKSNPSYISGSTEVKPNGKVLSDRDKQIIAQLKKIDASVRAHEAAHVAAGGSLIHGGVSYNYAEGPDGNEYAVGGEVQIDISSDPKNPQETISKMQQVIRAALAPLDPSPQDRATAALAATIENSAETEIEQQSSNQFNTISNPQFNTISNPQFNTINNPQFSTISNPQFNNDNQLNGAIIISSTNQQNIGSDSTNSNANEQTSNGIDLINSINANSNQTDSLGQNYQQDVTNSAKETSNNLNKSLVDKQVAGNSNIQTENISQGNFFNQIIYPANTTLNLEH